MSMKTCKNRKLGENDCWPLDKLDREKFSYRGQDLVEIIVIPSGTTQGYLLSGEFKKNKKMFRFGLPRQIKKGSYAWAHGFEKELTKCCNSKKAVMIDLSRNGLYLEGRYREGWYWEGLYLEGRYREGWYWEGLYRSPLHEAIDNKEFLKDVKKLFMVKDPDICLDGNEKGFELAIFRGYLAIRNSGKPTVGIDVLELSTKDGKKKFGLDVDLQKFDDDTHLEEYAIGRFCEFQQTIADLYYSTKVLDVLGENEI